ncbi:MAG: hypothetical protein V4685_11175 [Bacteroidota bacterium]
METKAEKSELQKIGSEPEKMEVKSNQGYFRYYTVIGNCFPIVEQDAYLKPVCTCFSYEILVGTLFVKWMA